MFLTSIVVFVIFGTICFYSFLHPFIPLNADIKIIQPTYQDLTYYASILYDHGNEDYYISYRNKEFYLDLNVPQEYFVAVVSVEFKNSGLLTLEPKYLTLKKDNDIVGFSESSLKYASISPGETGQVVSRFICQKNGKTDAKLKDFIFGLDFYLVQEDNVFGKTKSKVSLKKYA